MEQVNRVTLINDIFKIADKRSGYIKDDIEITDDKIKFKAGDFSLTFIANRLKVIGIKIKNVNMFCDDEFLNCEISIE